VVCGSGLHAQPGLGLLTPHSSHPSHPPVPPHLPQAHYRRGMAIISLICNVQRTSEILERVFRVFGREKINVQVRGAGQGRRGRGGGKVGLGARRQGAGKGVCAAALADFMQPCVLLFSN